MIATNQTTHDLNSRNIVKHMLPPYTADRPVEISKAILSRQEAESSAMKLPIEPITAGLRKRPTEGLRTEFPGTFAVLHGGDDVISRN